MPRDYRSRRRRWTSPSIAPISSPIPLGAAAATRGVDLAGLGDGHALGLVLFGVVVVCGVAADVVLLVGEHEGDAVAAAAGTAGAADAVHVALVVLRRIEVDHVRDVLQV